MSIEFWIAIIGLITALVTTSRWLMSVWHKNKMREFREKADQEAKVESLKDKNARLFVENVEGKLKVLETVLNGFRLELHSLKESIDKANGQYAKFDTFIMSLKNFILNKDTRLKNLESEVVKINNEIVMIKGKKNGSGTQN